MNKPWMLLVATALIGLVGCQERYRYPCQDPENWDQQICKKPFCSANGTCPEDLTHYEKKGPAPMPSIDLKKGDCKC
jgi:hypothetical protein